jgi:uncharacterized protein with HEPN domain
MVDEINTWLYDILQSINEIESYFFERPKEFLVFVNDIRTKRAIERNLEIIGEALNRIIKQFPDIQISNSRKIIDLRNRIIHGYDTIADEVIWGIIINHIPILKKEIESILES